MKLLLLLALVAVSFAAKTKDECKEDMMGCAKDMIKAKWEKKMEGVKKMMEPCKTVGECICPVCMKKAVKKSMTEQCPDVDMDKMCLMKGMKKMSRVLGRMDDEEIENKDLLEDSMTAYGTMCLAKKMPKMLPMICKNPQAAMECAAPRVAAKVSAAIVGIMTGNNPMRIASEDDDDDDDEDITATGDDANDGTRVKREVDESPSPIALIQGLMSGDNKEMKMMLKMGMKMGKIYKEFKRSPVYKTCHAGLDSECQAAMEEKPSPIEMMEKMGKMKTMKKNMCGCIANLDADKIKETIEADCGELPEAFTFEKKRAYMSEKMKCDYYA